MSNTAEFNLDLLDISIDDIEDLPSYDTPPDGTYQLLLNATTKVFEGKEGKPGSQAVSFDYEITNVIQLADSSVTPPVVGSKFNELFGLSSDDGIKYLKKAIMPYAEHFGTTNLRELIGEKLQNVVITATMKARVQVKDKEGNKLDEPRRYAQIKNVVIA